MKKYINQIAEKIFNPFLTDKDLYRNLSNLQFHQNVSLGYVNSQLAKYQIDPNKVNLGTLSKITFSEISNFKTLSTDDIFILTINFVMLGIILLKYVGIYEKIVGKLSEKTKTDFNDLKEMLNYFIGFLYLIYSFYMIRLIFSNKQFVLTSRMAYLFTYGIAGVTIALSFFQNLF